MRFNYICILAAFLSGATAMHMDATQERTKVMKMVSYSSFIQHFSPETIMQMFQKVSNDDDYLMEIYMQAEALKGAIDFDYSGFEVLFFTYPDSLKERSDGKPNLLRLTLLNDSNKILAGIEAKDPGLYASLSDGLFEKQKQKEEEILDKEALYDHLTQAAMEHDLPKLFKYGRQLDPHDPEENAIWERAFRVYLDYIEKAEQEGSIHKLGIQLYNEITQVCQSHTKTIEQQYTKDKYLGKGNFGEVYLYKDNNTGDLVAMKRVKFGQGPEISDDTDLQDMLLEMWWPGARSVVKETLLSALFRHEHLVRWYDLRPVPNDPEMLIFVMEYINGGSLDQFAGFDLLTDGHILGFIQQVLFGLEHMHSFGIVHRDIKPENVLLTLDGVAKVADFGLSTWVSPEFQRNTLIGTAKFLHPSVTSKIPYGPSVDIWSVAMSIFRLVEGEDPYGEAKTHDELKALLAAGTLPIRHAQWSEELLAFYHYLIQCARGTTATVSDILKHEIFEKAASKSELAMLVRAFNGAPSASPTKSTTRLSVRDAFEEQLPDLIRKSQSKPDLGTSSTTAPTAAKPRARVVFGKTKGKK